MRRAVLCLALAVWGGVSVVCGAEEPDAAAREAHRAKMKELAASIRIADAETAEPIELNSEPVLLYTDATRATHESGLWIWGNTGRPAAIMAVEYYPQRPQGPSWLYEIVSFSAGRISAARDPDLNWVAQEAGITLQEIAEADAPAGTPARRLLQMKQLLRRFAASESAVIEGRIELRLMNNALHRYSDPDNRIIDGGVFAFTNGTNPEVFILLEAHQADEGPDVWNYAVGRMTGGAVAVSLDGQEVWTCEPADPPASRESYVNGWITLDPR